MAPTSEEMAQSLEALGHRLTEPRRLLLDLLAGRRSHFTADEIWQEGRRQGLFTGRATVFRTLELLAQVGLLDRIHGEDGSRRYAVCEAGHHHHLVCKACGAVVPLGKCVVAPHLQALAREFNFQIEGHHLEFYGRCEQCRTTPADWQKSPD